MATRERRGRFAPTPSGYMHVGNAMTALLAWLQIRQAGGTFLLRIEDIDMPRSKPRFADAAIEDLRWLGLDWDEGPDVGGPFAPYEQSRRLDMYDQALRRLEHAGRVYPCFCSRAELAAIAAAPHGLSAEGPAYPGLCRTLSDAERAERARSKRPSIRFVAPDQPLSFQDGVAGTQHVPAGFGGDFVVFRADGIYGYQLAVVVDDALMNITDVFRGWDLLDSTPRQIWLYEALGWQPPDFAHGPLLCGPDGQRLAKRHGDTSLQRLRANGVSPEWIVGCLAYWAGLLAKPEAARPRELIPEFGLERIPPGTVTVDPALLSTLRE